MPAPAEQSRVLCVTLRCELPDASRHIAKSALAAAHRFGADGRREANTAPRTGALVHQRVGAVRWLIPPGIDPLILRRGLRDPLCLGGQARADKRAKVRGDVMVEAVRWMIQPTWMLDIARRKGTSKRVVVRAIGAGGGQAGLKLANGHLRARKADARKRALDPLDIALRWATSACIRRPSINARVRSSVDPGVNASVHRQEAAGRGRLTGGHTDHALRGARALKIVQARAHDAGLAKQRLRSQAGLQQQQTGPQSRLHQSSQPSAM